jgi:L-rhamnose mutarotase
MSSRVCFTLQVDPAHLAEYKARHANVWPEMLQALRDAGWRDYTLHLREDGLLVGTLLTDDLDSARAAMARTEVNGRWQAEMARFFRGLGDDDRPDTGMQVLEEIFDLDAQLDDAGKSSDGGRP